MLTYIELIIAPFLLTYSIFLSVKWKKASNWKKIFIILSILTSILIAYNGITGYKKQKLKESIEAKYGEFINKNKSYIPKIRFGNPESFITVNYPENTNGIFLSAQRELIEVYVKDGKLYVNAVIRDYKKEIIAVISDNTWKIFDENYEYNNDENSFELVTKGDRNVFMHIEFKSGYVYVEGFLISENFGVYFYPQRGFWIWPDQIMMHIVDSDNDNKELDKNIYFEDLKSNLINPIFKYPREKYLGVRVDKN
jgi:hypothetical protein